MNGRITAVSTASWISNITRFVGSNGSTRDAVVAQPASSAPASPKAAARRAARRALIDPSLSAHRGLVAGAARCGLVVAAAHRGLVRARRRSLVEQKLPDQLFEDHRRLRLRDLAAVGKHRRVAARVET